MMMNLKYYIKQVLLYVTLKVKAIMKGDKVMSDNIVEIKDDDPDLNYYGNHLLKCHDENKTRISDLINLIDEELIIQQEQMDRYSRILINIIRYLLKLNRSKQYIWIYLKYLDRETFDRLYEIAITNN